MFQEHFSYVFHSLRRLGVRRADLEDLTHEVFVAVHRALPEFDPRRPLRPWLFGIAFRIASDYRRRARFTREVPGPERDVVSDAPLADEQLEEEETRRIVIDALGELDLDQRAVVVLHEIDGCPVPEVAAALSIPLNTAYSRLRLGRERLRTAVKRILLRRGAA